MLVRWNHEIEIRNKIEMEIELRLEWNNNFIPFLCLRIELLFLNSILLRGTTNNMEYSFAW